MDERYDVAIIGSGPAGLTAALYTSRARLRTVVVEKETMGGELINRDMIENYPGYQDGVMGPDLASNMLTQVMNLEAQIKLDEVEGIETEGAYKVVRGATNSFSARAIIIACGASNRKLGVPGEAEFANRGVFYCATCDGSGFAGKPVAVAGGGNSGVTEALFLTRMVSRVTIVELMPRLTADKILQEKLPLNPKIEVRCGWKIEAIRGEARVKCLDLVDSKTGQKSVLDVEGILVRVGVKPNTDFLKGKVGLDDKGYILVDDKMATTVLGVFAAGDVRHGSPMQITTAVGDGTTAALAAEKYLMTLD